MSGHVMTTTNCPRCHSSNLRKSESGNARLPFPLSLLVVSVRCHTCNRRFLRFGLLPGLKVPAAHARLRPA
jgi:transposase-like protein